MRHVDADDLRELTLAQQGAYQRAFAAAEVEHACRSTRPQVANSACDPLLVQPQRCLDDRLFGVALCLGCVRVWVLLGQPGECLTGQSAAVSEVACRDRLASGVGGQPALTVPQQLLELIL